VSHSRQPTPPTVVPVSAGERAWLWGALLAGLLIRIGYPYRMAVEHFDEAIYASNVLFGAEANFQYPGREFYAPPLLPMVIEWLHVGWMLGGGTPPSWLPMLPALSLGCATIASLWWIARGWFGPQAAIVAAWSLALCEFHAAYSRTALTDVPLTFFLLWAVYWLTESLKAQSPRSAWKGGLWTALAWWTKYNGWLPLAMAATASVLVLSGRRAARGAWINCMGVCALAAVVAGCLWLPVLHDCQDVGGYAAIAKNHRGYVEGWSAWRANAHRQFAEHGGTYAGWLTVWGLSGPTLLAAVQGMCCRPRGRPSAPPVGTVVTIDQARLTAVALNALSVLLFPDWWFPLILGVALVCSALAWRRGLREQNDALMWPAAMVFVWVLALLVVTPLYRAYPRLCLPLMVGSILGSSIFWRRGWIDLTAEKWASHSGIGPAVAVLVSLVVAFGHGTITWEDRSGYRQAAWAFQPKFEELSPDETHPRAVAYALTEPGFFYQLRQAGVPTAIAGDIHFLQSAPRDVHVLVAIGPLAGGTKAGRAQWDAIREQFEPIAEFGPARLSSIVRLDQDADWRQELASTDARARYHFYRWRGDHASVP